MSKYIDAIRQEIERQLEYFKGKEEDTWDDCDNYTDEDAMWYQGHWKMCSRLLSFIDSLPEEACKDSLQAPETCKENADSFTAEEDGPFDEDEFLEDELSAFLQNYDKEYDDDAAVSDVARHFYEIGKKQKEQKPESCDCSRDEESYTNGIHHVLMNPEAYGLIKLKPAKWSEEFLRLMGITISQDGNQVCVLLGENLAEGIAGFGDTLADAVEEFKKEWRQFDRFRKATWKPSKEQMEALENSTALNEEQGAHLYSLLCDLKKLL